MVDRLTRHLFDRAPDDGMVEEVAGWLTGSAQFRAFVDGYRDKVRKKLRGAMDEEARRDVRAELRVAQLLLADRQIGLAFEPYGSGKAGPDFTVTFRGTRSFNLEVTRTRRAVDSTGLGRPLLAKLRQLPPSVPNAVLVAVAGESPRALDVDEAVRALRIRAEAKDDAFFVSRGFAGTRAFNERYRRLGAVFVWCEGAEGDARATLWINRSARIALPERAARACLRRLGAP